MRKKLFVANWKMNKKMADVRDFCDDLAALNLPAEVDVIISASFTLVPTLAKKLQDLSLPILPAAQNLFYEDSGAFTGEVSGPQLVDSGAKAVILGHSERRRIFGETNEVLNKKLKAAIKNGLFAVFSVGENEEERAAGKAKDVVKQQIEEGFAGLSESDKAKVAVAYEPVWAIGTGKNATPEQAEEMLAYMRTFFPDSTRLLYGGSVNEQNASVLLQKPSVDGFLIGGASLVPESFYKIITA